MNGSFLKLILGALAFAPLGTSAVPQGSQPDASAPRRVRTMLTANLPPNMHGEKLRATLVTVQYGPGEASPPHSHGCPVIVYVLEGTVRSKIKGHPETTYRAGESFYEPPGGLHLVSANGSKSSPARFLAFFVCDHDGPFSSDPPDGGSGAMR